MFFILNDSFYRLNLYKDNLIRLIKTDIKTLCIEIYIWLTLPKKVFLIHL